jgi:hypothetical protein
MKNKTHKICANPECDNEFKLYKTTDKYCSPECQRKCNPPKEKKPIVWDQKPRQPIKKFSKQRLREMPVYNKLRIEVLSDAKFKCFIDGCTNVATTCEHTMGRKGYADEWARDNNISLYIDKRFLKACCYFHNSELENNPELSKEYQLSKIHGGKK